jgi:hypothetical protein
MARTPQNPTSTLFVGGIFNNAGPGGAANLAELKDGDWRPMGDDLGQGVWVWSMTAFDDGSGPGPQLYASRGYAGVVRLGESGWQAPGQGLSGSASCLATLTVGNGGQPALFAGGRIRVPPSTEYRVGIARFDGQSWQAVGEGLNGSVYAITAFDDGLGDGPVLFAGGSFQPSGAGTPEYVLARWSGNQWQYLGQTFANAGLNCLAVFDDGTGPALYAGGLFRPPDEVTVRKVVRWHPTKSTFTDVGGVMDTPGESYSGVRSLAVFDDGQGPALFAAGQFTHAGGNLVNHIARWSVGKKSWMAVGGGITSTSCTPCLTVYSLQTFDDGSGPALYAGGYFAHAGNALALRIARWDGRDWTALGLGLDGIVLAMTALDGASTSNGAGASLYIGGAGITTAGGIASSNIAKWSCVGQCAADIVPPGGNGAVNIDDLVAVITAWGSCAGCAEDIDDNGGVDIDDLVAVITDWGPCD